MSSPTFRPIPAAGSGSGDMTKAVYDTDDSGTVDDSTLWDGQALPSINSATGGQVLALKSDKSALEFTTVSGGSGTGDMTKAVYDTDDDGTVDDSTLWDGQALPSIDDATGGQVLALKSDKSALEFATVLSSYTLPVASADTLGGVKIGDNLSIDGSGVLSAVASPYELPTASADVLGGVKIGSGITITDGVISVTGGSGGGSELTWTEVTGTTQSASADNGYITNNESLVTITLPSTCAVGKTIRVVGKGAGLWKIAQNAGQQIIFGNKNTTIGTSGYIASLYKYDSVELLCITADTVFSVTYAVGDLDVI